MLRNFAKTAFRNLVRYKAYSLINLIGLSCGMAVALLIFTYIRHEVRFDRFHEKADRLYRIAYSAPNDLKIAASPPPIAPKMKEYFPGVEEVARVYRRNVTVALPEKGVSFEETNVLFADSSISELFTFTPVAGSLQEMLRDPFTAVISDEIAMKYFGNENPVGQSLLFAGKHLFRIAAVVKSFPPDSHIEFSIIVPYDNMFDMESDAAAAVLRRNLDVNFIISHSYTYVLLRPGADPADVDAGMPGFLKKYSKPDFLVGQTFTLMPLTDIHLYSTMLDEPRPANSVSTLLLFAAAGILTLLIACINYINLSTAQSLGRLKEIGIRKILGSQKGQLIFQFIAESFLFCLVALVLAMCLFYYALPLLNLLTGTTLDIRAIVDSELLVTAAILLITVTLLAGAYPAVFVTRFESVNAIRGGQMSTGNEFTRKILVTFQLCISFVLLSGAILIVKQLRFLESTPLGFERSQIVTIPLLSSNLNSIFRQSDSTWRTRLEYLRKNVESMPEVKRTTLSSTAPGLGAVYRGVVPEGFSREDNMFAANMTVDYDFADTYAISLAAGRWFDVRSASDRRDAFIVNETAVRQYNWENPEKALGRTINREGKIGKVIGVVRDFHFTALTTPVSPLILEVNPSQVAIMTISLTQGASSSVMSKIEKEWLKVFPEKSFEYQYLEEEIDNQYNEYQNFGVVIEVFAVIAIVISCMGVYGLVLFVVQRKVKEIGIRKVLGASIASILSLIYKDFIVLLVTGFVLAVPLSWYLLSDWLENFTYRTAVDPISFVLSFCILLSVVGITVGIRALRASMANPADSIRID